MNLGEFLIRAEQFALSKKGVWLPLPEGAQEFSFSAEDFYLRERRYGSELSHGEILVWKQKIPYWFLSYRARNRAARSLQPQLQKFLVEAHSEKTQPPFGPKQYKNEEKTYLNKWNGAWDIFEGEERVIFEDKELYRSKYIGGLIF